MRNKIRQYIRDEKLFEEEDRLIVGLSGGVDSVVLLNILMESGFSCIAAHCNFHLRGDESDRDERFVANWVRMLGIPLHIRHFDTEKYASDKKISIEMAARELRYDWFEQLRQETKAHAIAIAHHKNDSIETFLINLIRGTGIHGLVGIRPGIGRIVRPLLCVTRDEILAYADANKLSFVTDSTNLQDEFVRNKIRLKVIPLLQTINPAVNEALFRTSEHLFQAEKIYNSAVESASEKVFDKKSGVISIVYLRQFPAPETLLYEILSPYGFSRIVIREAFHAIDSSPGKVFYSATHRLIKDRDTFLLSTVSTEEDHVYEISSDDKIIRIPFEMSVRSQHYGSNFVVKKDKQLAYLDADRLVYPLILRKWRYGDRFIPLGMRGFKKLSDYFIDVKFNCQEKENIWLLCSGDDIVWLVGERIDDRYKVNPETKTVRIFKLF